MNIALVISAVAGFVAAAGHSWLGETKILGPMFRHRGDNRVLDNAATRRVIRWVWHLPSFAWAQTALVTIWLMSGEAAVSPMFAAFGAAIYLTGAAFNLYAVRTPHIGNIVLGIAGAALLAGAGLVG